MLAELQKSIVLRMLFSILVKGLLLGFVTSLPLGPIGVIIIQRTVTRNRWAGFSSGVGAALSDSLYASVAGVSVSLIMTFISEYESLFEIVGSLILIALGIVIFMSHPERCAMKNVKKRNSYLRYACTTFFLTISNPLIIFLHLAFFSRFGIVLSIRNIPMTAVFIAGFFVGALCWWFTFTGIINLFRKRFTMTFCLWFNRIAGAVIIVFVSVSFIVWLLS